MLREVINSGTGVKAKTLNRPLAGKTGTTNDFTDAWFIGFTPSLTCGVWVGFDDHHPLGPKEEGARVALPIWMEFMAEALKDQPVEGFPYSPLLTNPEQVKEILASAGAERLSVGRSPSASASPVPSAPPQAESFRPAVGASGSPSTRASVIAPGSADLNRAKRSPAAVPPKTTRAAAPALSNPNPAASARTTHPPQ
jgi:penicillin-binding protein 1A